MTAGGKRLRPEVKAKWIEALRSGRYAQGRNRLHGRVGDQDTYCCLGVLCDIAASMGVTIRRQDPRDDVVTYGYLTGYPPKSVVDWAYEQAPLGDDEWAVPLPDEDGHVAHRSLAVLNDDLGLSFDEIADVIEESL